MNLPESTMTDPNPETTGETPQGEEAVPNSLDALLKPEEPAAPSEPEPTPEPVAEKAPTPPPAEDEAPEEAEPAAAEPKAEPAEPDKKHWYIVKVQSNREDTIKDAIERRVKIEGLEEFFDQILVPVEKVSELRNGKRVVRTRKMFPGYIMAHVEFNDRILYLFRETSGVGDFVGASANRPPQPMPPREVEIMLRKQQAPGAGAEQIIEKIKVPFDKGDKIRVRDGTFAGMEGEVKEIMEAKDAKESPRVRVELTIFGRPVPVEVEVWQVEQL
ncbi:MAG: transcription termination/antitermination protein NusG [Gemmataceae bacterium]